MQKKTFHQARIIEEASQTEKQKHNWNLKKQTNQCSQSLLVLKNLKLQMA